MIEVTSRDLGGRNLNRIVKPLAGLLAVCALLAAPGLFAQSAAEQGLVRRLMDRSGTSEQLRAAAKSVADGFEQARDSVPEDLRLALGEAAREGFGAEAMLADVERELPRMLTAGDMQTAIAWLETDVGRRVTRVEEEASRTLDSPQYEAYLRTLKDKPLADARVRLLRELLEVTDGVEFAIQLAQATAFGVAFGMNSTLPRERRIPAQELRRRVEEAMSRDDLAGTTAQAMLEINAFTYRDANDADLLAYLAFLKTPAGQKYVKAFNEVLLTAISAASYRTGSLVEQRTSRTRT